MAKLENRVRKIIILQNILESSKNVPLRIESVAPHFRNLIVFKIFTLVAKSINSINLFLSIIYLIPKE